MADIHKIDPEQAAHNIATIFSDHYIRGLDNARILDVDGTEVTSAARKAAQLYAVAFDEAFEYFDKENKTS
ncbi:hypothetical protein DWX10_16105 [Clostridium sp. AF18-27]|uniref:hypothetical protein n=1 Tax=Enterocloster lavalensis TaxID=460384 RepID=UPI000E4DE5BC|nr:hypothetical protein [Enterocloster lavalensis]RHR51940.1 hypothetical protein DWX10_16105 [Clostridium sp. AF18-27]